MRASFFAVDIPTGRRWNRLDIVISLPGLCIDPITGESAISVGDDSQMKQWRLPDPGSSRDLATPVHSIALKWIAHDVTHSWAKAQFAVCGDGIQIWQHER